MTDISYSSDPVWDEANVKPRVIRLWLSCVAFLVFCIVIVGGATRLTDSGLSITEWLPIMGAIPPLNDADWQEAFAKYKQIPEYVKVNAGMSLEEFKFIFWWEWGHRQLGRLIGLALLVPLVVFWARGWIPSRMTLPLVGVTALVGLQGALGWYMVASGLVGRVDVSQYRLAAHLSLAIVIFGVLIWLALRLRDERQQLSMPMPNGLVLFAGVLMAGVFLQIVLGAFVAGMRAGLAYNTWPLMDGDFIPDGLGIMTPWWSNLFENALTVQFNHRMVAYGLVALCAVYLVGLYRSGASGAVRRSAVLFAAALGAQVVVGILTLLWQVPILMGLAHQGLAVIVFGAAVWHYFEMRSAPKLLAD